MGNSIYDKFKRNNDAIVKRLGREILYRPLDDADEEITIYAIFKKRRREDEFGTATREYEAYTLRTDVADTISPHKSDNFTIDSVVYGVQKFFDNGTGLVEWALVRI